MTKSKFAFDNLLNLLGRSENDPTVRTFFGQELLRIKHDEYYGSLEFRSEGVDVVFKEASWVVPARKTSDPRELYVAAFHLYRGESEGFAQYAGQLPKGIFWGDFEEEVIHKMGQPPLKRGGGAMSSLLNRAVPHWFWYAFDGAILHFQLDGNRRIEMMTVQTPGLQTSKPSL